MKLLLILLYFFPKIALSQHPVPATRLLCEYKSNPLAVETQQPRFSWQLPPDKDKRAIKQTAYQIQVAASPDQLDTATALLWDSGPRQSDQSIHIPYEGKALTARSRYFWRVKIWDNQSGQGSWSEVAHWEMALLDSTAWQAQWIEPVLPEDKKTHNPSPLLRKTFHLKDNVAKARLYITAHGVYEAFLNGQRVGDELFTPGWTSYHKRLQYQTFDVTTLLQESKNVIAVQLGDGWYRGKLNWKPYGFKTALLCQLEIEYKNGKTQIIRSDTDWKAATGAVRMSNIYQGEVYDARLEQRGWNTTDFDDRAWAPVQIVSIPKSKLVSTEGLPVRKMEMRIAQKIIHSPKGETLIDMGQNMVGWIQLKVKGKPGDTITLYHAEVLDKTGNFYTDNLRKAAQKVQYILADTTERSFEPHFTFQGFRYVKVEGLRDSIRLDQFTGVVIYSDMEKTGFFECSHPMINQLQSNIEWGQKGNFLDVPTDCPQRDERMGWTGDAQAFARTACYNFNTAAFYTKWLQDLSADQLEDGAVPWVVPDILKKAGSTGWGDAATIVPWTLYELYGDVRILERQYESMKKWLSYLEKLSEGNYLVQQGFHYGDWLFFIHPSDWNVKPGHTDIDFIATAFFAYSTQLTIQTAKVLQKEADVQYYEKLLLEIQKAFQHEFVTPSGRLSPHSQTAYTLALAFDLLTKVQQSKAVAYLVADIKARDYHLSTGFLGTPHLCKVLSDHGQLEVAYRLLFQETYPSWLYPISKGATTIWERWDGIKPDGSFQAVKVNSFNHYAYGAIGDWMYRVVAGIEADPAQPGYKHIRIQPKPNHTLTYAKATYDSVHGRIASHWVIADVRFQLTVQIPSNTSATVLLPKAILGKVLESGKALSAVEGIFTTVQTEEGVQLTMGSGTYVFSYPFGWE
jgi:alpha-L-rhamnosidase